MTDSETPLYDWLAQQDERRRDREARLLPWLVAQDKRSLGRYTIGEAVELLYGHTGGRITSETTATALEAAALSGTLPMYHADKLDPFTFRTDGVLPFPRFGPRARAQDLNAWLDANRPLITWRFPVPGAAAPRHLWRK